MKLKLLSIISLGFLCSAEGFFPLLHVGLTSSTCYIELGRGHCVDANNKRLPHCHTTAIESEANCRSICNGNKGCTAYEWGQRLGKLGPYCQLIQPAGDDGACPSGFAYTKTTATNPVEKTFHDTNGGKCFIKRTCYIELGHGHCVDANNNRPPHCYTTAIESEATCRSICNGNKGCTAYEWGQRLGKLGPYCQLIQPAGGDGVCPSGFAYTKTTATNPVEKTFHDTNGGKCFIKRKDASMYPKSSKDASMSPKPSKAASTSPKPSKDASMSERHYVHSMHGNMNGTDGFW